MRNAVVISNSLEVLGPVLQALRSFSRAPISVIGNDSTRSIRWSLLCDHWSRHTLAADDDAGLLQKIHTACARDNPSRIIAVDCDAAHALNRIRSQLPAPLAPMPSARQLALLEDKWQFHRFCQQQSLPSPLTLCFTDKRDLHYRALASALGPSFVVKPSNLAGSQGVRIITSESQFEQDIVQNESYEYSPLLAQQYIPGADIDISVLAVNGKVKTLAVQQVSGSVIRFVSSPELEKLATRLCDSTGYDGVMHIDARIQPGSGRIWLIESNPRFWASLTAALWCGLNFVQESLRYAQEPAASASLQRLDYGSAYTRYPLLRPGGLRCLLDRGLQGQLLRLSLIDPWRIGRLMQHLSTHSLQQAKAALPWLRKANAS